MWPIALTAVVFVVATVLNLECYIHNVRTIEIALTAFGDVDSLRPSPAEQEAAVNDVFGTSDVAVPRMTLTGEFQWLVGRELVICGVLAPFIWRRKPKQSVNRTKWTMGTLALGFVILTVANVSYYRHNVRLMDLTMNYLAHPNQTGSPAAEESAAAASVIRMSESGVPVVGMSVGGEFNWLVGREAVLVLLAGASAFIIFRRPPHPLTP